MASVQASQLYLTLLVNLEWRGKEQRGSYSIYQDSGSRQPGWPGLSI